MGKMPEAQNFLIPPRSVKFLESVLELTCKRLELIRHRSPYMYAKSYMTVVVDKFFSDRIQP